MGSRSTQEQATRWLGALALGLRQQGQTVFLIEQLQPSWLPARMQRAVYILSSRLIEGLSFSMIFVVVFHRWMHAELGRGLLFSLAFAAIFAAIDVLRLIEPASAQRRAGRALAAWQAAVIVPAAVLAVALTAQWLGQTDLWIYSLFGFACGPAWASRSALRSLTNDIQPVETARWSWSGALKGGGRAALLIAVLQFAAPRMPLELEQKEIFLEVLRLSALLVVLMGAIDSGLRSGVAEMKTIPNQGIQLSGATAARVAGVALLAGSAAGLLHMLWVDHKPESAVKGLLLGALSGLFLALLKGGLEVLRHGILRIILFRKGYAPWRLAAFLDEAADELHFLQKVGGGYMFIHRSLLEYFAALGEEAEGGEEEVQPASPAPPRA